LTFAGDTSFTHGLADRDPLGDVVEELSAADLTIVNLETTVAEANVGRAIEKTFTFKSPPKTAGILADAGVDVAALANNHALDYGPDAVIRTIEILNEGGVVTAGTGPDPETAYAGIRLDVRGWDVAVLSFSRVPCDSPEPGESYIDEVAWACPQFEQATIDAVAAATDADLVVVMVHWGIQSRACAAAHQHDLAARWVAAGADVVVGSHPHVLQGVEVIDGAWVIHSTGNFAFPSAREQSSYSALFTLTVAPQASELAVLPVRIRSGRPVVATSSRAGILNLLTDRSFGFAFDEDGIAGATGEPGRC
jgi:poly-gamma-glutamate synthesis protein (capsule biosynthesis protein)